jgi:hypothetical protein
MKRITLTLLAIVGALTLLIFAFQLLMHAFFPTFAEMAKGQFGTPEAVAQISALYLKIEAAPKDPALVVVSSGKGKTRNVPKSWLPKRFSSMWGVDSPNAADDFDVVHAYFDEKDAFIGIEFVGSRYGCFASRDATRCPSYFGTLHRLAEKPLFITTWVAEDEK